MGKPHSKLGLSVRVLPWDLPKNGELLPTQQLQQGFPLFFHPCFPYDTVGDLCYQLVARFESVFPNAGELRIKCLETDNGDVLDSDLLLGDCFTYRTASDQPSRWTVCVRREPPTAEELRLLGNIRFSSIVTDSGARPPKRPYGMIRGPYGGGGGGHGSPTGPHAFKRSRKESGSRAGAHDQNQPVASLERDGEAGETRSSAPQDRISSVLVEDSQKQRNESYNTPQSIQAPHTNGAALASEFVRANGSPIAQNGTNGTTTSRNDATANDTSPKIESPGLTQVSPFAPPSGQFSFASASESQMIEKPAIFTKPPPPQPKVNISRASPRSPSSATTSLHANGKSAVGSPASATASPGRLKRPSEKTTPRQNATKNLSKSRRDVFDVVSDIDSSQELPPIIDKPPSRSNLGLKKTSSGRKAILPESQHSEEQLPSDQQALCSSKDDTAPFGERKAALIRHDVQEIAMQTQAAEFHENHGNDPMEVDHPEISPRTSKEAESSKSAQARVNLGQKIQKTTKTKKTPKPLSIIDVEDTEAENKIPQRSRVTPKATIPKKRGRPSKAELQARLEAQQLASRSQERIDNHVSKIPKAESVNKPVTDRKFQASINKQQVGLDLNDPPQIPEPNAPILIGEEEWAKKSALKAEKLARKLSDERDKVQVLSSTVATTPHRNKSITPYIPGRSISRSGATSRSTSSNSLSNRAKIEQWKRQAHTPSRVNTGSMKLAERSSNHRSAEVSQKEPITKPLTSEEPSAERSAELFVKPIDKIRKRRTQPASIKPKPCASPSSEYYHKIWQFARDSRERSVESNLVLPGPTTQGLNMTSKPIKQESSLRTETKATSGGFDSILPSKGQPAELEGKTLSDNSVKPSRLDAIADGLVETEVGKPLKPILKKPTKTTEIGFTHGSLKSEAKQTGLLDLPQGRPSNQVSISKSHSRSPARIIRNASGSVTNSALGSEHASENDSDVGSDSSSESTFGSSEESDSETESEEASESDDESTSASDAEADKRINEDQRPKPAVRRRSHRENNSPGAPRTSSESIAEDNASESIAKPDSGLQTPAKKPTSNSVSSPTESNSSLDAKEAEKQLQLESSGALLTSQVSQGLSRPEMAALRNSQASSAMTSSSRPSLLANSKYPSLSSLKNSPLHVAPIEYPKLPSYKMPLSAAKRNIPPSATAAASETSSDDRSSSEDEDEGGHARANKTPVPRALADPTSSAGSAESRHRKHIHGLLRYKLKAKGR